MYKTELCAWWMLMRCCSFGDDCVFAHGVFELRGRRRPLKYKTKICENIASYGSCPYGWRCHFIHPSNDWVSSSTVDSVGRVEELLGGKLSVESEQGAGTTIQLALPVGVDGTPPGKPSGSESSKRSPGPTGVMPAEEIFVSLLASQADRALWGPLVVEEGRARRHTQYRYTVACASDFTVHL